MFLVNGQLRGWELNRVGDQWRVASQPATLPGRLLAVGADGATLVCATADSIILVNKEGTSKMIPVHDGIPIRAALSYDSRYLAYTVADPGKYDSSSTHAAWPEEKRPPQFLQDYGMLHLLDVSTGTSSDLGILMGNSIGFHPSRNLLAIGDCQYPQTWIATVSIVNVETLSTNVIWTQKLGHVISQIAWSPDGEFLAFLQWHGPHGFVTRARDASLWIISADGKRSAPLPIPFARGYLTSTWNLAWRND